MTSLADPSRILFLPGGVFERRRWLSERAFVDLVALRNFSRPGVKPNRPRNRSHSGRLSGGMAAMAWIHLALGAPSASLRLQRGASPPRGWAQVCCMASNSLRSPLSRKLSSVWRAACARINLAPRLRWPRSSCWRSSQFARSGPGYRARRPRRTSVLSGDLGAATDDVPCRFREESESLASARFSSCSLWPSGPSRRACRRCSTPSWLGRACLWRRPCRAAAVARCRRDAGVGFRQCFRGRIRGCASRTGTSVRVRRLPRRRRRYAPCWRHRRGRGELRDIYAGDFGAHGRLSVIGHQLRAQANAQAAIRGVNAAVVGCWLQRSTIPCG